MNDKLRPQQMAASEQGFVLIKLAEQIKSKNKLFLEVGSWCGDSTVILGEYAKQNNGVLYCVDWWRGNIGTDLSSIAAGNDVFQVFWNRIKGAGLEDYVIPIRGRSDVVAEILGDATFDLIYLDGDHRYSGIKADIESYKLLI